MCSVQPQWRFARERCDPDTDTDIHICTYLLSYTDNQQVRDTSLHTCHTRGSRMQVLPSAYALHVCSLDRCEIEIAKAHSFLRHVGKFPRSDVRVYCPVRNRLILCVILKQSTFYYTVRILYFSYRSGNRTWWFNCVYCVLPVCARKYQTSQFSTSCFVSCVSCVMCIT